jgi:pimeloyl-ACP methyl ester carboxylesterase
MAQPGQVKANGITIAYESFGSFDDPAIVLIQGTGATLVHWPEELCQILAGHHYRVIRFDNRDIGLSSKLDSLGHPDWEAIIPYIKSCEQAPLPYTLLDMAKDVTGLMGALKITKAHIVGASMGGAIAQLVAIHFPGLAYSLTIISASSGNPDLPAGDDKALEAMSTPPPDTTDPDSLAAYLVKVYKALGSTDTDETLRQRALGHINRSWYPEGTERQIAAVLIGDNCDRRKDLAGIRIPTMVIHGDSDPLVPLSSGQEVANTIPGSEMCVIKGMGHDLSVKFIRSVADCIIRSASRGTGMKGK